MDQLRLFKLKHDLLKISVDLKTELAADTHLAEGQWLKEQLNVVVPTRNTNADFAGQRGNI
jgi:hypothetical protein